MPLALSSPWIDSSARRHATALLVAAVFFMENLDATVIITSLPAIARDFGVAPASLSMSMSAYLVALTVFIPVSGWAADRFGARRMFTWAIVVFTAASTLCAASQGVASLTAARALQGIGGAMMVPVGRLIVLRDTPRPEIVRAIALLTWPALTAPVLGPLAGGWISTHWGWHWIFLLNLPLGVLALAAALLLVRTEAAQAQPFDWVGFILSGLGFGLFMAGVESASQPGVAVALAAALGLAGVALLMGAAWHFRRVPRPLLGLAPLAIPTFRLTAVGGSLFRTAVGAAPFLLPLMFQLGFGWSAVEAGALLLWLFAGNLAMKPATTAVMNRFGFRRVLISNGLLVAAGFGACALLGPQTPPVLVAALMFATGMTRSMQFTALNTVGFADIPPEGMRDATTLFSVLQQMNAGMGIAVGALLLAAASFLHGPQGDALGAFDFQLAFCGIAGLAALAVVDACFMDKEAGNHVLH